MLTRVVLSLVVLLLTAAPVAADDKAKFDRLLDDYWEYHLADRPQTATYIGDSRYDDKLFDNSAAAYKRRYAEARRFLKQAAAIRPEQLAHDDRVTLAMLRRELTLALEGEPLHAYLQRFYHLPMNQIEGPHLELLLLPSEHPFRSERDYRNYIARLTAFSRVADDSIAAMREGIRLGVVHPRPIVERMIPQLQIGAVKESPLYVPVKQFPAAVPEAARRKLTAATERAIQAAVKPAFARLLGFMRDEYLPKSRTTVAWSQLPSGRERYAYAIKVRTTRDLSAEQIHAIAQEELEQAEGERRRLVRSLNFEGTPRDFNQQLQLNRELRWYDAASVERDIRNSLTAMEARLPKLFKDIPPFNYELKPVEPFRAPSFPIGAFFPKSPDNARPGVFYYNTHDIGTEGLRKFMLPNLSFHEAIPGHMLQSTYANANRRLHAYRRLGGNSAYNEGWAMYAERLADEVGAYPDAYARNFYLSASVSAWTSAIAETGIHDKGWTMEQAYAFLGRYLPMSQERFDSVVARWAVLPAYSFGYGLTARTIRELRAHATAELGDRFDVREFHSVVLNGGSVPADVLTTEVHSWVDREKRK